MKSLQEFDVIVLGSGFAGSLLGTILAVQGKRVAMIDSQKHPRFAIGESATPLADLVLRDLAGKYSLAELLPLTTFGTWQKELSGLRGGCKRGFSYFWHGGENGFQSHAGHSHELLVSASVSRDVADTHWYRADVDQYFAQLAVSRSVELWESARVGRIGHLEAGEWEVEVETETGRRVLRTGFLVDATGPAGVLMSQLEVKDWTSRLHTNSTAIYSHFEGMIRFEDWLHWRGFSTADHPFPCDDAAVHQVFDDGWLWQLRFECGLTSVGFLYNNSYSPRSWIRSAADSAEGEWVDFLSRHPPLEELLQGARLAPLPGRTIRTDRLQRLYSQAAGADWAALPFTVGFIDPLHSTGIAHSLLAVERLAAVLAEHEPTRRDALLKQYSLQLVQELQHIDRLVSGCYQSLGSFDLFTAWTMIYFAAATTCEHRRLIDPGKDTGFLCAMDERFYSLVVRRHTEMIHGDGDRARLIAVIRESLEPFNHVGLFAPAIPNMYSRTSAEKGIGSSETG